MPMNSKVLEYLTPIGEAVGKVASTLLETVNLSVEKVSLLHATRRISARDYIAEENAPKYSKSAVDGFAVLSNDTVGASHHNPAVLRLKADLKVNQVFDKCVDPGEAVRIQTGTIIPCGADAVVMEEDVSVVSGQVYVYKPVSPGQNIMKPGEDYRKGDILVEKGRYITPLYIAALASAGHGNVEVYRKIRVGIIAIGDELIEPGSPIEPGRVYEVTGILVRNMLEAEGFFETRYYGIVGDSVDELENSLNKALDENDFVITTGATGVSSNDIVYDLVSRTGKWLFRGVRMRPGRPTSASLIGDKLVIHFSGFPVAAWTGYEAILRPAIARFLGLKGVERTVIYGKLSRRVPSTVGYATYIRVQIHTADKEVVVEPYMLRGSGVISSLFRTQGYIVIPEDVEGYDKGVIVPVYLHGL